MSVRAKFRVNHVEPNGAGHLIHMHPVYSGSPENEEFFKATPGGQITLYCVNTSATEQLKAGTEVYVDFTPAEHPPKE